MISTHKCRYFAHDNDRAICVDCGQEYPRLHCPGESRMTVEALLDNAMELLAMKPPEEWTVPERVFAEAVTKGTRR